MKNPRSTSATTTPNPVIWRKRIKKRPQKGNDLTPLCHVSYALIPVGLALVLVCKLFFEKKERQVRDNYKIASPAHAHLEIIEWIMWEWFLFTTLKEKHTSQEKESLLDQRPHILPSSLSLSLFPQATHTRANWGWRCLFSALNLATHFLFGFFKMSMDVLIISWMFPYNSRIF